MAAGRKPSTMIDEQRFIAVEDGLRVWTRRLGGGAADERAPLLVLHGGPGFPQHNGRCWRAARTSRTWRCRNATYSWWRTSSIPCDTQFRICGQGPTQHQLYTTFQ